MNDSLEELRAQIDGLDDKIASLLLDRFLLSKKVALLKRKESIPLFHPEREGLIIENRQEFFESPEHKKAALAVFSSIISSSRMLQGEFKLGAEPSLLKSALVAFGPCGSFEPMPPQIILEKLLEENLSVGVFSFKPDIFETTDYLFFQGMHLLISKKPLC